MCWLLSVYPTGSVLHPCSPCSVPWRLTSMEGMDSLPFSQLSLVLSQGRHWQEMEGLEELGRRRLGWVWVPDS